MYSGSINLQNVQAMPAGLLVPHKWTVTAIRILANLFTLSTMDAIVISLRCLPLSK